MSQVIHPVPVFLTIIHLLTRSAMRKASVSFRQVFVSLSDSGFLLDQDAADPGSANLQPAGGLGFIAAPGAVPAPECSAPTRVSSLLRPGPLHAPAAARA